MSSWGNLDNVKIKGTVTVYSTNTTVNGASTEFNTNVKAGDYITIVGTKYQVDTITSNTVLNLTTTPSANNTGNAAYIQNGPVYIRDIAITENTYTIQRVYGVDSVEVLLANNVSYGNTHHTGWNHVHVYTDAYGARRIKSEVLVAMSKNFNKDGTGTLQADYIPDNSLMANV
jgi:hypothetical protein